LWRQLQEVITNNTTVLNARRLFENELFRPERKARASLGHVAKFVILIASYQNVTLPTSSI